LLFLFRDLGGMLGSFAVYALIGEARAAPVIGFDDSSNLYKVNV